MSEKRCYCEACVPEGFLSDVMTAAGLLAYGLRDKGLSQRLGVAASAMLAAAPYAPASQTEAQSGGPVAQEVVRRSMKECFDKWEDERVGRRALVKAQQAATIDPFELFAAGFICGKSAAGGAT